MTDPAADTHPSLASVAGMATVIANILDKHGATVLDDRQRLIGLLHDKAPTQARGIRVLISVYDENVPQAFVSSGIPPSPGALARAANIVIENTGLQADLAQWAVDVWAAALASPAPTIGAVAMGTAMPEAEPAAATAPSSAVPATATDAHLPPPQPPAPSSDDLVWGGSDLVAADTVKPAPDYVPAPSYQLAPSATTPPPSASPPTVPHPPVEATAKTFLRKWKLSHVVVGVLCLAAIGYLSDYLSTPTTSSETSPNSTPVAGSPKAEPAPQSNQQELAILSTDPDATKWPLFEAGVPVKDLTRSFQFQFNFRHPNGHYYTYRPTVTFPDSTRRGKGVMVAVDQAANTQPMLSETAITAVSRDLISGTKTYSVSFITAAWVKNPSVVPSICLSFTSGSQATKFEPDRAHFCVTELKNSACGMSFGCGRLK